MHLPHLLCSHCTTTSYHISHHTTIMSSRRTTQHFIQDTSRREKVRRSLSPETGRWGGVSGPQPISQYLGGRLQGCQSYLTISARLLCHIFSDPRHATAAAGCTAGKCRICPTRFTQPDRLPLVGGGGVGGVVLVVWCWCGSGWQDCRPGGGWPQRECGLGGGGI